MTLTPHLESTDPKQAGYGRATHQPINQLLLIVPLLVIFQVGSLFVDPRLLVPEYMKIVLLWFGATGPYLPAGLIVATLVAQHLVHRRRPSPSGWAALGMLLEAVGWAVPLLMASWLTGRLDSAAAGAPPGPWADVLAAVGAGVFEEFLFRLVLISLVMMLFVDLLDVRKLPVAIGAVILSGLVFATCHFPAAELTGRHPLDAGRFVFLAAAGGWWGVVFIARGYGVAAASHIWWDLLVIAWST